MRIQAGILAVVSAIALPATVAAPSASADGHCRAGYSIYDIGSPGSWPEDRNLNGLVCDKTRQMSNGDWRHWVSDDR